MSSHATSDGDQPNHFLKMDFSDVAEDTKYLEEEDMDVPDIIEDIIELLHSGLRDTVCQLTTLFSIDLLRLCILQYLLPKRMINMTFNILLCFIYI